MCPHGYHHSGSMATPALGTRDVRLYIYIYIFFFFKGTIVKSLWRVYWQHKQYIVTGSTWNANILLHTRMLQFINYSFYYM